MELDKFALVERILKDVDNILRKNVDLNTFDIVPVDSNIQNKSPVLHLENCIGLESWCIKHVYMICYSELMDSVPKSKKKNKPTSIDNDKLIRLLNVTLLINSDVTSLWNRRRELVTRGLLDARSELRFAKLVLSRKAKSNDAFAYRRWILNCMLNDVPVLQSADLDQLITEELHVCTAASEKCPNNYHSWSHRTWLLKQLALYSAVPEAFLTHLYCSEFVFSEHWTASHVSDHSCFHYRQFCIQNIFKITNYNAEWHEFQKHVSSNMRRNIIKIMKDNFLRDPNMDFNIFMEGNLMRLMVGKPLSGCRCEARYVSVWRRIELLFYELSLNDEMIRFYKNHETLWYHRRFIIHNILSTVHDFHGISRKNVKLIKNETCSNCQMDMTENKAKIVRYDPERIYSSVLFVALLAYDQKLTMEQRADGDNYADRHEKYMKFIQRVSP